MPHCHVEYSSNLVEQVPVDSLIQAVYQGALAADLFAPNDIKVRSIAFDNHLCGELHIDFVHVTLRILSGRPAQAKKALSEQVLRQLTALALSSVSLTVEVCDIDRESYAKSVLSDS